MVLPMGCLCCSLSQALEAQGARIAPCHPVPEPAPSASQASSEPLGITQTRRAATVPTSSQKQLPPPLGWAGLIITLENWNRRTRAGRQLVCGEILTAGVAQQSTRHRCYSLWCHHCVIYAALRPVQEEGTMGRRALGREQKLSPDPTVNHPGANHSLRSSIG